MEENGDNDVFTFIPIFAQNFFNLFSKLIFYAIPLLRKYLTLFMCVDLKALQYLPICLEVTWLCFQKLLKSCQYPR